MTGQEPGGAGRSVDALDPTDRRLIEVLRQDGRCSVNELAERAGVSRANAYQRLARLRTGGVITGFTVRTDPRRTGLTVAALVIVNADQHSWRHVLEQLRQLPGARYVALTAGGFDFVVLVRVADVETLRDVILERLQTMPGVRSTQTMFILEEYDQLDG
jgi:DNA-binding Lrp family transcriptional regulator